MPLLLGPLAIPYGWRVASWPRQDAAPRGAHWAAIARPPFHAEGPPRRESLVAEFLERSRRALMFDTLSRQYAPGPVPHDSVAVSNGRLSSRRPKSTSGVDPPPHLGIGQFFWGWRPTATPWTKPPAPIGMFMLDARVAPLGLQPRPPSVAIAMDANSSPTSLRRVPDGGGEGRIVRFSARAGSDDEPRLSRRVSGARELRTCCAHRPWTGWINGATGKRSSGHRASVCRLASGSSAPGTRNRDGDA